MSDHMPNAFIVDSVGGISASHTHLVDGTSYLVAGDNISIVSQSNGSVLISTSVSSPSVVNVNSSGSNLGFYGTSPVPQANTVGQVDPLGYGGAVPYTASSIYTNDGAWQAFNVTDLNFAFLVAKITQLITKVNAIDTCLSQVSGGIGITH